MLLSRLRWRSAQTRCRIYAIGDVHGCYDLFVDMIDRIRADIATRPPIVNKLVVLGDIIDRGPKSAAVCDLLLQLARERNLVVLKGNHEAAMLAAIDGDFASLDMWLAQGGLATLASYGVNVDDLDLDDSYQLLRIVRQAIPAKVVSWLRRRPTYFRSGRYYFVHAGIRPGIALEAQTDDDRLWIRDAFIESDADHGAIVIHGHSIEDRVVMTANRIAVDTGAYRTGRLSAVAVEGDEIWHLTVEDTGSR